MTKLCRTQIRLKEKPDELAWTLNKTGGYHTAKLGYRGLQSNAHENLMWWWDKIWKIKAPIKTKKNYVACFEQ